ncbi:MAG: glutathione S-transferase family protein [Nitratireductor sp.]
MTDFSNEIILHNYPQSPVAEKARVVLGMKNVKWHSVEIPRIPPKPMLTLLTGGYRRTPVMQIGADIFCDSLCIINELDARFASPPMYPQKDGALAWCLGRWADGDLFNKTVAIVLGSAGDALPPDFAQDRGRLYFGPNWAQELQEAGNSLPHLAAQMRANLQWLDQHFSDERAFMMGDAPSAIDAQLYQIVWFLRGRWEQGPAFLDTFTNLVLWENRVKAIGHGEKVEMSAEKAIEIAKASTPQQLSGIAANEPQSLQVGTLVHVSPDVDGAEQPVEGNLVFADAQKIVISRQEPQTGAMQIHFPRSGYEVKVV